mgnify:CR=1 FL=1
MNTLPDPFYDDGQITIYCGDSLAICPLLVSRHGPAAALTSDWPYTITAGSNSTNRMHGGIWDPKVYDNKGKMFPTLPITKANVAPLLAACRADADVYMMVNDKHLRAMLNSYAENKVGFHNLLIWQRGTKTPNKWGMKDIELICYGWQGKARTWNDMGHGVQFFDPTPPEHMKVHPTQKPDTLFQSWIELSTDPGELVIDPFMGVGPALVGARRAGRRAIGVELQERYCEAAVRYLRTGSPSSQTSMMDMLLSA